MASIISFAALPELITEATLEMIPLIHPALVDSQCVQERGSEEKRGKGKVICESLLITLEVEDTTRLVELCFLTRSSISVGLLTTFVFGEAHLRPVPKSKNVDQVTERIDPSVFLCGSRVAPPVEEGTRKPRVNDKKEGYFPPRRIVRSR
ncbi:hypothetical protein HPB51_018754 [Rhipicephalus microplus]|uniref:Uncharacterized protein n=1 Tax=Rhipicephalus microplus TaxID=6941 RepID=A0A9J6DJ78_RHIMP|nr:hypothetical protein HPB51_018754 [Rhipicephalus microplus]